MYYQKMYHREIPLSSGDHRLKKMDLKKRAIDYTEGEKKRQKVGHYFGLENQGATCYLNSVLQILFMTTEIHDRLNPEGVTDYKLKKLFGKLKERACGTTKITKALGITNVHQQYDAALCLKDILHKVSPQVSEVFQGQLSDATKCAKGHPIIEETNPFLLLPLALQDADGRNYDVKQGFEEIFQDKLFSGDNKVYCNECDKKTKATSTCQMVEFPHVLVLLLKRFDRDHRTMKHVKSDRCVEIPGSLKIKNKEYKLYGMVNHSGGLRGGHYTATILSEENQTWYEFNDSHVEPAEEQPFANAETHGSRTAYLLVYREFQRKKEKKKDLDEPKGPTEEHQKRTDSNASRKSEKRRTRAAEEKRNEDDSQKKMRHQIEQNKGLASTRNKSDRESFLTHDTEKRPEEQNEAAQEQVSEQRRKEEVRGEDTDNMSEKHEDHHQRAEETRPSKKEEKDNERSTNPLKNPIIPALIICAFLLAVILILIVVLTV